MAAALGEGNFINATNERYIVARPKDRQEEDIPSGVMLRTVIESRA